MFHSFTNLHALWRHMGPERSVCTYSWLCHFVNIVLQLCSTLISELGKFFFRILPLHEGFKHGNCLMLMCSVMLLCITEFLGHEPSWSTCCSIVICDATGFKLMVMPVRFTPDCTPMLLFNCLGHPTFRFAIGYHRCKMLLIKLLRNELLSSPLLQ